MLYLVVKRFWVIKIKKKVCFKSYLAFYSVLDWSFIGHWLLNYKIFNTIYVDIKAWVYSTHLRGQEKNARCDDKNVSCKRLTLINILEYNYVQAKICNILKQNIQHFVLYLTIMSQFRLNQTSLKNVIGMKYSLSWMSNVIQRHVIIFPCWYRYIIKG